jgi:hypothetical protein
MGKMLIKEKDKQEKRKNQKSIIVFIKLSVKEKKKRI